MKAAGCTILHDFGFIGRVESYPVHDSEYDFPSVCLTVTISRDQRLGVARYTLY